MALYLGDNKKLQLILDGVRYDLKIPPKAISGNYGLLLSSDNYVLKDSNDVYLRVKEEI